MAGKKKKENATGRFCQRSVYISLGYQFPHMQAEGIGFIIVIDLYAILTHKLSCHVLLC